MNGRPVMQERPGSEFELPCELVLLALGFLGPELDTVIARLGCELTERGNLKAGPDYQTTVPGAFACGDARRGQSLVVRALWEGLPERMLGGPGPAAGPTPPRRPG